jgi:hypothetical protein
MCHKQSLFYSMTARRHCTHDHHSAQPRQHDHEEEESLLPWGHAHAPEPEQLAGGRRRARGDGLRRAAARLAS